MYSMENQLKTRRVKSPHSLVQVRAVTGATKAMKLVLNLVERVRSFHSHKTLATDVGKADTRKYRTAKLQMQCAEVVEKKGALQEGLPQGEMFHTFT